MGTYNVFFMDLYTSVLLSVPFILLALLTMKSVNLVVVTSFFLQYHLFIILFLGVGTYICNHNVGFNEYDSLAPVVYVHC